MQTPSPASTAQHAEIPSSTLPRTILEGRERYAEKPIFREKRAGQYRDISWDHFSTELRCVARGLLEQGIAIQAPAAIIAPNSPAWAICDLAIQSCRGVTVPVYHTEGLSSILYILQDSGSHFLFAWSAAQVEELLDHLDDLPELKQIILLEGRLEHDRVMPLVDFRRTEQAELDAELDRRLAAGEADELASIVYTSGTTGPPKGVMLTHHNFLSNMIACGALFDLSPRDICLSFLPLSHVFERMAGYYLMLFTGVTIGYAENFDSVPANMREIRPTVMISVPRLYEKMYARVMDRVLEGNWFKRRLFFTALRLCEHRLDLELSGHRVPAFVSWITDLARARIFGRLREPLGGRLRFFVSGGAPLHQKVASFFLAVGIPIYEGYGLTETAPVIAVNYPGRVRLGTVGQPLPKTEVKIAADGEILVSGPQVFRGYWQKPEQTREALEDGWFHTGDIGELDDENFLAITDRKKDLIVTAGGENIPPQEIEKQLKSDKFIANVMVYGDRRPFLTALVVPNFDNLTRYARLKDVDFLTNCDLVNHPRILDLLRRRIEQRQSGEPDIRKIKRFTLLSRDFSSEQGEVTPTQKVRRKVVRKKFRQIFERMYEAQDHGIHDAGFCIIDDEDPGDSTEPQD